MPITVWISLIPLLGLWVWTPGPAQSRRWRLRWTGLPGELQGTARVEGSHVCGREALLAPPHASAHLFQIKKTNKLIWLVWFLFSAVTDNSYTSSKKDVSMNTWHKATSGNSFPWFWLLYTNLKKSKGTTYWIALYEISTYFWSYKHFHANDLKCNSAHLAEWCKALIPLKYTDTNRTFGYGTI